MPSPTKFYDRLISHMEGYIRLEKDNKLGYQVPHYVEYLKRLRAPECMRILFDAKQAALFDDLGESPDDNMQRLIHPPFDFFYLEFTEPILLGSQEPGYVDMARAILYTGSNLNMDVRVGTEQVAVENAVMFFTTQWDPTRVKTDKDEGEEKDEWVGDPNAVPTEDDIAQFSKYGAPALNNEYENSPYLDKEIQYVDRAWTLLLSQGLTLARVVDARYGGSEVPPDWDPVAYFRACGTIPMFKEDRVIGWWEEAIDSYTSLLSWICAYTMAKSIQVEPQFMSRPQRRWHERKGIPLPKPWHVVKVEPKFSKGKGQAQTEGSQHSYRYDVMGHLRYGRHKRGDGSYSETIEWVPPHQRGLANELYIPKTSKVERGKIAAPAMRRYYGEMKGGKETK